MDLEVEEHFELDSAALGTTRRTSDTTTTVSSAGKDGGSPAAIAVSVPSVLRNGSLVQSNHLPYLLNRSTASSSYPPVSSSSRTKPRSGGSGRELGRRKQRRSDNARLLSNPHAVRPTIKDYRLHSNQIRSTFPLSPSSSAAACLGVGGRKAPNLPVPDSSRVGYSEPTYDAVGANAGQFGKSLKDAQRVLRRLEIGAIGDEMVQQGKAGELERFIWLVDREIRTWANDEIHLFKDAQQAQAQADDRKVGKVLLDREFQFTSAAFPGLSGGSEREEAEVPRVNLDTVKAGEGGQLIEFQRTPNALVWLVHDAFLRLIVHCLARVSKCPSFSKDDVSRPGLRFTWILNPNPLARRSNTRGRRVSVSSSTMSIPPPPPAHRIVAPLRGGGEGVLETPPTTDFDSHTESELGAHETETETETETEAEAETDSLADSVVIVHPAGQEGREVQADEEEGDEADREELEADDPEAEADTDEEQAEILRRVRRWAIDSHGQRRAEQDKEKNAQPNSASRRKWAAASAKTHDADATLTSTTIAEEDDEGESNQEEEQEEDVHA